MKILPGGKYYWTTDSRNVRVKAITQDDDGRWKCRLLEPSPKDNLDKFDTKSIKEKNLSDLPTHPRDVELPTPRADEGLWKAVASEAKQLEGSKTPAIDKIVKKAAPPRPPAVATPLEGVSIVHCGDSPVIIMCGLNASWSDLACFHIPSLSTRHLARADLEPKDAVDATISALQKHIKINPTRVSQ